MTRHFAGLAFLDNCIIILKYLSFFSIAFREIVSFLVQFDLVINSKCRCVYIDNCHCSLSGSGCNEMNCSVYVYYLILFLFTGDSVNRATSVKVSFIFVTCFST